MYYTAFSQLKLIVTRGAANNGHVAMNDWRVASQLPGHIYVQYNVDVYGLLKMLRLNNTG